MDVFLEVIKRPDFDSKLISFGSSLDILQAAEEARLKDRLAVAQKRSHKGGEQTAGTKVPQFILYDIFDILGKERELAIFKQGPWFNTGSIYINDYYFKSC